MAKTGRHHTLHETGTDAVQGLLPDLSCVRKSGQMVTTMEIRFATAASREPSLRIPAEQGATAHEIISMTGHRSLEEVERYTRATSGLGAAFFDAPSRKMHFRLARSTNPSH